MQQFRVVRDQVKKYAQEFEVAQPTAKSTCGNLGKN